MNGVRYGEFNMVIRCQIVDDDWFTITGEEVDCQHVSVQLYKAQHTC